MLKVTGENFLVGYADAHFFKSYIIPPNTVKKLEIEGLAQLTDEYSPIEISRLTIQHNITTLDDFGNTVLHRAVLDGDSDLVKFLLSFIRFNSHLENKNGKSAREMAIAGKNQKLITTFNNQAQVDLRLLKALVAGDKAAAQTFMLVGANPNVYVKSREVSRNHNKYTPLLSTFCSKNNYRIVDFLISKGADVNSLDSLNRGPLRYALMGQNIDIVTLLLDKGVSLNTRDIEGMTSLRYLVEHFKHDSSETFKKFVLKCIPLLLSYGANPNIPDNLKTLGRTPLMEAAAVGFYEMVHGIVATYEVGKKTYVFKGLKKEMLLGFKKDLFQHDLNVNQQDSNGTTALMLAVINKHFDIFQKLLKSPSVKLDLEDNAGRSVWDLVAINMFDVSSYFSSAYLFHLIDHALTNQKEIPDWVSFNKFMYYFTLSMIVGVMGWGGGLFKWHLFNQALW